MFRIRGLLLTLAALLLVGCNAAGDSPVTGDLPDTAPPSTAQQPLGSHPGLVCWGVWDVSIDPVSGACDLVPLRNVEFMANVTMFLQPPSAPVHMLTFSDIVVDMDSQPGFILVDLNVGLKHPFPGLDEYTGFDVKGLFMHDHQYVSADDPSLTYAGPDKPRLLNADGYSRWMNATEFTSEGVLGFTPGKLGTRDFAPDATLNGYKYFCDGLGEEDDLGAFFADPANPANLTDRGCFRTTGFNWRHYSLIWPDGPIDFQYAVIAAYDEPDPIPPENIPDDYPITANCAEALHLYVDDNDSTAYYEGPGSSGGDLHLSLEVYDWGVLAHGGTVADEIGSIVFESPIGLIASPVTFDPATLVASPGSTDVSSVYEIDIVGVNPSGVTGQTVLVKVTSAIHDTYDYGFGSAVPDAPLAAYMIFDAPIRPTGGDPPTAVAEVCTCHWIALGESVTFSGEQSYSPNGDIVNWEWDFNGDGLFNEIYTGPMWNPTYWFPPVEAEYYVDLRVTDVAALTDTLGPGEKPHIHVGSFTPPTANAYICPTIGFINFEGDFEGSGSTGTINLYEWDFEGDCIWDYEHPTIGDTTHAYTVADIYNAVLRVTGTGCDLAETEVRMIDPLGIFENGNFWDGDWDPWTHGNGGRGNKSETIEANDTYKWMVHFLRTQSFNDGGICWARQDPDYDVSGNDDLHFNFFFKIVSASLGGDGYMGGELDMAVRIVYDDGTASAPYWKQAWFGWDLWGWDHNGIWQWDDPGRLPDYVTYHEQEIVAVNVWHERQTPDLMEVLDPPPITIKWVRIDSSGWDFNTYFALPWFSEE